MPERQYFHGGVRRLRASESVLPPRNTGAPSLASFGGDGVTRRDRVYLTTDPDVAAFYALMFPPRGKGWVYEVEPVGAIELDPDWLGEPGESIAVPFARVIRVVERDVRAWHGLTARQATRQLLTLDGDDFLATKRLRAA